MGYPVRVVLRIVQVNSSTWYYRQKVATANTAKSSKSGRPIPGYSYDIWGNKVNDLKIMLYIKEIINGDGYPYGYIKITHALRAEKGLIINKKKVYRICKQLRLLKPQRKLKQKYPRRIAINRVITSYNQLWETDIKYGYIVGEKKFFYVLSILDIYDRGLIAYHMGLNCTGLDAATTVKQALINRGILNSSNKPIIRSDNGPQFRSTIFNYTCEQLGMHHEMIPVKTPNKNAHIESFHNLLQSDCLGINVFETYEEAYAAVKEYMDYYNNRRLHSAVGYKAPYKYYLECVNNTAQKQVIKV